MKTPCIITPTLTTRAWARCTRGAARNAATGAGATARRATGRTATAFLDASIFQSVCNNSCAEECT